MIADADHALRNHDIPHIILLRIFLENAVLDEECRKVVTCTAIDEDVSVTTQGGKEEGNGHRGAHSVGQVTAGPVLGFHRHEVSRHTAVWDRQCGEVDGILISNGETVDDFVDIVTIDISVGQVGNDV